MELSGRVAPNEGTAVGIAVWGMLGKSVRMIWITRVCVLGSCVVSLLSTWLFAEPLVIGSEDFEGVASKSGYAREELAAHVPKVDWWQLGKSCELSVVADPERRGGHRLSIGFPPELWGSENFRTNLSFAPWKACRLEYSLRFEPGFEFSQGNGEGEGAPRHGGGKLPGLAAGSHPSGGLNDQKGMSARLMWRRDDRHGLPAQTYLELYLYWPSQTEKYGDRFYLCPLEAGKDYRVVLEVDVGTPGKSGWVRILINDKECLNKDFVFIPEGQSWAIDQAMIHFFYGGNDPTWAPRSRTYLLFDDLRLTGLAKP